MTPKWEHGYRCHGYWLRLWDGVIWRNARVGYVGLDPYMGGTGNVKDNGYGWGVSVNGNGHDDVKGRTRTLRAAKLRVEREYRRLTKTAD